MGGIKQAHDCGELDAARKCIHTPDSSMHADHPGGSVSTAVTSASVEDKGASQVLTLESYMDKWTVCVHRKTDVTGSIYRVAALTCHVLKVIWIVGLREWSKGGGKGGRGMSPKSHTAVNVFLFG